MTLEALLTFVGILVGVLAIARPVQRQSLLLFVPWWVLPSSVGLALILLIIRDTPLGVAPPFGWSLPLVLYGLTLGAFLIPVAAAGWGLFSWHNAKLTDTKLRRVEKLFHTSLREQELDEFERIVRRNQQVLDRLPPSAASLLFHPDMVKALTDSRSMVHFELLANLKFLKSLENRFAAVEVVVRDLLRSSPSPLQSAVVARYGGVEHLIYTESERNLMERTFENPEWYLASNAHYPLIISAIEALRTGKFDESYNGIGENYEASQGISSRASCPVYLAIKAEVLAIEAGWDGDFYISDLWQIFAAVLERSSYKSDAWKNSLSSDEFPTPYAYLLYEIGSDLRSLAAKTLPKASGDAPRRFARDLAQSWSFCVWRIAGEEDQVSARFRSDFIREYLIFVLALKEEPNEIYHGSAHVGVEGLLPWRDLFLGELREFMVGNRREVAAIREAFDDLDRGKMFISRGSDWLEEQLALAPPKDGLQTPD